VLSYVLLSIPGQLRLMVPIAALVGASIGLSALARANELIAMKASGVGPVRIAVPVVAAAAGISLLLAAVQERIIPPAERESRQELDRIGGKSSAREADGGRRWIVGENDRLWAYLDVPAETAKLVEPGVVAVDWVNARVLERIEAHEATYADGAWDFLSGWRRSFDAEGRERYEAFPRWRSADRESPELFGAVRTGIVFGRRIADQMTFVELRSHVRRMADAGYDAAPLIVGLNEKLVMPLLPVVLVLVAVPLMVSGWSRRGSLAGFGYALVIVFGFWVLWAVSTSLGSESVIDPVLAVWSPPILVGVFGIWLLGRAR
jgi:LPS export ABC transporter permease LptG